MPAELDEDKGVLRAGIGRIGGRPVVKHAHVGDDHLAFLFGDGVPDKVLNASGQFFGVFDAQPRRCPHTNHKLAGVHWREKFSADNSEQPY